MNEPVILAEAKLNARADGIAEDGLFAGWITTGRRWVENYTGHLLVQREVTERFDGFSRMRLRAWPIAPDAQIALTYADSVGATQAFTGFRLDVGDRPAVLVPMLRVAWPYGSGVTVTVQAGYATPADVPAEMRSAIMLIVNGLYVDRTITSDVERAATALCHSYRLWSV